MWFKNVRAYRLTKPFDLSPEQLGQKLAGAQLCALRQIAGCVCGLGAAAGWGVRRAGACAPLAGCCSK